MNTEEHPSSPQHQASPHSLITELPTLYGRWTLDCVIEVARSVSLDFVSRPRHYRLIRDDIAEILQDFKALTGNRPDWPDLAQRTAIYGALVGDSDGKLNADRTAQFHQASIALRERAIAFAERVYDTGEDMLRQAFRDAMVTLRSYLNTLQGRVVALGYAQTGAIFGKAVNVLSSKEVASVFGLPPAPGGEWPLKGIFDGNGAYLIEEVTRMLQPAMTGLVSQQQFIVMQRIADYGPQTITGVLDDGAGWDSKDRSNALIQSAYSWATALRDIKPIR